MNELYYEISGEKKLPLLIRGLRRILRSLCGRLFLALASFLAIHAPGYLRSYCASIYNDWKKKGISTCRQPFIFKALLHLAPLGRIALLLLLGLYIGLFLRGFLAIGRKVGGGTVVKAIRC